MASKFIQGKIWCVALSAGALLHDGDLYHDNLGGFLIHLLLQHVQALLPGTFSGSQSFPMVFLLPN